jgi:hypothetical protein
MPRRSKVPSYRLHKPSGQARVIIGGEHLYLGPYGSAESREKYARLVAERFAPGAGGDITSAASASTRFPGLPVNEQMIREVSLSRQVINSRIDRIKRIYKWAGNA